MIYLETKGSNGMTDFVIELDELNLEAQTLGGLRYTDQYNGHSWIQAASIVSVSYNASNMGTLEIWATMPDGNGYFFRFQFWGNRNDPDATSRFYFLIGSGTDPSAGGFQVYYSHYQGFNEAVPEMVEGYYPVSVVPELAQEHPDGNGGYHQHVLGGKTYYMAEGLTLGTNAWHGDYPSYVAPGSGVQVEFTVSDDENAGWDGAIVYLYENDTGLVAGSFGCGPGENGTVHTFELKANVEYVWDVKFMTYAIGGNFTGTRVDTGEDFIYQQPLQASFTNMYGSFELVVHAEDYSLLTMSASVIDGTSAEISTEWTPYTLANAAGWAASVGGGFGSVGAQWSGAVFAFGSSGTLNFPSAGLQSVEVAAIDGSGNVLYISSAISVNTSVVTITVTSADTWGDGWNGTKLEIYGSGGGLAGEYTLVNGAGETVEMILPAGDYTWALTTSSGWNYPEETSVSVTDPDGNVIISWTNGTPESGSFSLAAPAASGQGEGDSGDEGAGTGNPLSPDVELLGVIASLDSQISLPAQYTINIWVKNVTLPGQEWSNLYYQTSGYKYILDANYGAIGAGTGPTRLAVNAADPLLVADTWHLVTVVFDGSTFEYFVNGYSIGSTTPGSQAPSVIDVINGPSGQEFASEVKDMRLYASARTAAEVLESYSFEGAIQDDSAPGDGIDGGDSGGAPTLQDLLANEVPDYQLVTVGLDGFIDYVLFLIDWDSGAPGFVLYLRKGDNTYAAVDSLTGADVTQDWATHAISLMVDGNEQNRIEFTDPSQQQGFMQVEVFTDGVKTLDSSKLTWMTQQALFNIGGHYFSTYIAPIDGPTLEGLMANADGWHYPSTETALCVHSDQPYKVHFVDGAFENLLQPQSMPYTGRNSFSLNGRGAMWVEGTVAGQNVSVSGRYSGPVFVDDAQDSDTDIDIMLWGYTEYSVIDHSATVSGQDMMSFVKYGDCFVQVYEGDIIKFDYDVQIVGNQIEVTPPAGKDGTDITVRVINPPA